MKRSSGGKFGSDALISTLVKAGIVPDASFGRAWAKWVHPARNLDRSKTNGFAFTGPWVNAHKEPVEPLAVFCIPVIDGDTYRGIAAAQDTGWMPLFCTKEGDFSKIIKQLADLADTPIVTEFKRQEPDPDNEDFIAELLEVTSAESGRRLSSDLAKIVASSASHDEKITAVLKSVVKHFDAHWIEEADAS